MPTNEELNGLSKLYNLDCENLRKKAQEFVDEHDKRKRGRRFSSMSGVQS